ncbi:MAG: putative O-glycosylation ligase, exosortase A system-associated [Candidatus Solibacter sp.]
MGLRAALLLAVLLPCVPLSFFRPFIGVICWTIISFAGPQWYAWGAAYYFPCAEMIAIPTMLGFVVYSRGWLRMVSRETILMGILWTWFTITTLVSVNTPLFAAHSDMTMYRWQFISKVLLMTVITMGIVDTFARLRILVMVTAGCFAFYVVKALPLMITTGGGFRLYGPPRSMVEDNNDLGLALNMTLPLLFYVWQTETGRRLRQLFFGLFIITIPGIFFTYSRGAMTGLVAVMTLMLLKSKQRLVLLPVVVMGLVLGLVFAPPAWKERMDFTRKGAALDNSAFSRLNSWQFARNLAWDYPIFGGGFDTFTKELFDRYAPNSNDVHGPHSIYFGVLAEHGYVGLALYLSLVVSCFASLRKIGKHARRMGDEVASAYANAFGFSLVGFLTSGLFLGRAYFDYYFAIICCIVVLKHVCFNEWRKMEQEEYMDARAVA